MSDANPPPKSIPTIGGLKPPSKIARPAATAPTSTAAITTGLATPKPASKLLSTSTANSAATSNSNSTSTLNMTDEPTASTSSTSNGTAGAITSSFADIFEFKVGDRVWLNGAKQGTVAYVGTTGFKEGEWVGLILDTPEGKNNGSFDGRVYFVTEEKRGVFCRPSKITSTQMSEAEANAFSAQQEVKYAKLTTTTVAPAVASTSAIPPLANESGLNIGDRVVINNNDGSYKFGTLRYIGPADFAKGEWAGVELDEKVGKNDGSVGPKRYFQCEPLRGLFIMLGKLELYNESLHGSANKPPATPAKTASALAKSGTASRLATPSSRASISGSARLTNKDRAAGGGSQESLVSEKSSIYSTASAALNRQMPKGVVKSTLKTAAPGTPNASFTSGQIPAALNMKRPQAMTPALLQQSLKEKEAQIAQLIKDRNFERAEFTKAAQQFEMTEAKLIDYTKQLEERGTEINALKKSLEDLATTRTNLSAQCDADKQRIEDLEFQIEEHKMGVAGLTQSSPVAAQPVAAVPVVEHKEDVKMVLTQLDLQKKLNESHLNEIKVLNKQVDDFKLEIAQLRLGDEVYSQEKTDLKRRVDELETELNAAKLDSQAHEKLKETHRLAELSLKVANEEYEKKVGELSGQLRTLTSSLNESENQRGELEFLYQESVAKLAEANVRNEEKARELARLASVVTSTGESERQRASEIEFILEEHKIQVQDLETKLSEKVKLEAEKQSQIAELEKRIRDLSDSLTKNANELVEKKTQELAAVEDELKALKVNLVKLELDKMTEAASKNDKIKELENRLASLTETATQSLNEHSNKNKEVVTKLEDELKQLSEHVKRLESEKADLEHKKQDQVNELESKLRDLNESLTKSTNDLTEKKAEEVMRLETEIKRLKEAFATLETVESQKNSTISDLELKTQSLNDTLAKTTNELTEKRVEAVSVLEVEIRQLKIAVSALETDKSALESLKNSQISDLERKITELNESLAKNSNELVEQKIQETTRLESEIKQLKERLSGLESEKINSENSKNSQITELEKQLTDIKDSSVKKLSDLKTQVDSLNKTIAMLEADKEDLKRTSSTQVAALEKQLNDLKQDLEKSGGELGGQINSLKDSLNKSETEKADQDKVKSSRITELECQLDQAIKSAEQARNEFSSQIKDLKESVNKLEVEKTDLDKAKSIQIFELEKQVSQLLENSSKSQSELSGQIDTLKASLANLETEKAELDKTKSTQIADLETQKQELNNKLNLLSSQAAQLNAGLVEKEELLKLTQESSTKAAEHQLNVLNEQIKAEKEKSQSLEALLSNSNKEIQGLNEKLKAHTNQLAEQESNLTILSQEKNGLAETNQTLKQLIETLSSKISANETLLVEKETTLASLNTENSALTQTGNILKQQIDALNASVAELLAENGKVKKELEEAVRDKKRLESEVDGFKNDSGVKDVVEQLQRELTEALEKIAESDERENQIKHDYEAAIRDLKDLLEQNDEAAETKTNDINELKALVEHYENEINNLRADLESVQQQLVNVSEPNGDNIEASPHPKYKVASSKPTPRLYCDICDQFDLHDTEDCPVQGELNSEYESHTRTEYKSSLTPSVVSTNNRAYCDLCEEFGHEEANCPSGSGSQAKAVNDDEEF